MSTVVFRRPSRQAGPPLPRGEMALQEPPTLPEAAGADMSSVFMYLPMAVGSGAMVLIFVQPGASPMTYVAAGLMGVSALGMLVGVLGRSSGERKRRLRGERRDYLRYLSQMRRQLRQATQQQATAVTWVHPEPEALVGIAGGRRLWERRPAHQDFAEIRVGTGAQRLGVALTPPQTKPVEDLEPLSAVALRRFIAVHWSVPGLPIAIQLRTFARVLLRGGTPPAIPGDETDTEADLAAVRGLTRALLAQLATFHAPSDVRIVVCAPAERQADWDWVKWLPHAHHPGQQDPAGPRRMVAGTFAELERLLGPAFTERPRTEDGLPAAPGADEPFVVIVLDGVQVPATSRFATGSIRNCTVVDVSRTLPWLHHPLTLRLRVTTGQVDLIGAEPSGKETVTPLCRPDTLTVVRARALARRIAPYRIGTGTETAETRTGDLDLATLLGLGDLDTFDPVQVRARRTRWDQLRVPIGVSTNGAPVELDIKEAAQGGMGPHGMLIGATGSGKSELLRTLLLALATAHSSETLNLVLVDFKGGATFRGFEQIPHTSAIITNLSEELPLVDRMQEALQGELIRRQELLRAAGFSALKDYEKARTDGAALAPLPTLFVVVDEFSELLSSKRDFIDLFVMIGRLGRSLGVHLLLASQRLDEGRVHQLESHLSYRMSLRTFSAMESRSVIGVPDAYELPAAPGNGYLRADTTTLIRFRAAYVSGLRPGARRAAGQAPVRLNLVPFQLGTPDLGEPEPAEVDAPAGPDTDGPDTDPAPGSGETVLEAVLRRLAGVGPQAHRVWLPPLAEPPTVAELVGVTAERPTTTGGGLRVPVGIIDRPLEQRRDPLLADLTGSGGHVGIVGGPQSGKSTLLRTLVAGLALTHSPREVQAYCLDFGGGTLSGLVELPHLGGVAGRQDRDLVTRTVAEIVDLLAGRERRFTAHGIESMAEFRRLRAEGRLPAGAEDGYGDVLLVVDGWLTLHQEFETVEEAFSGIATNGLNYGVHLVVTASRWSEIRPWLRDLLGTRFELRLGDPVDSEVGMRVAANVPAVPGRGLTREGLHFLAGLPRLDGTGTDDLGDAVRDLAARVAAAHPDSRAPRVRLLPATLPAQDLPAPTGARIALGLDDQQLAPVWHDFDQQPHLMVFGDTETGKTNLLRLLLHAVARRYTPDEARVLLADYRRGLFDAVPETHRLGYAVAPSTLDELITETVEPMRRRLPGPEVTPAQLQARDWWVGPRLFVVVDDYDLVAPGGANALSALVDLLPRGADIGLHLIVARTTAGIGRAMMMDDVLRRLTDLGAPALLFSCDRQEGMFYGDAQPRRLPNGRAQLIVRRRTTALVQTGHLPAASD
ncbi:type VII secretion protein EccCa [Micromonospora echinofusca]|uniref:Type VII secretion protein EccCa n=1 Tax=Micromonospora echinofusca TaxID=47858 RepID=A0ABS3VS76_MICEH|nr:type VII secretion protein EccCa [Micromonospora echinofusca]